MVMMIKKEKRKIEENDLLEKARKWLKEWNLVWAQKKGKC